MVTKIKSLSSNPVGGLVCRVCVDCRAPLHLQSHKPSLPMGLDCSAESLFASSAFFSRQVEVDGGFNQGLASI